MKLSRYGMVIKKHMEETYPIRYNELVIDGIIMDKLLEREQEIRKCRETIQKQLEEKHPKPVTKEFIVMAKYNQMIESMTEELLQPMLYEKI